jgi:hypothetical protein
MADLDSASLGHIGIGMRLLIMAGARNGISLSPIAWRRR